MERLAEAMWCLQVTPRCIDMAQETEWMNEWSPKAWSWQLKNHHYNKLKFGETERESCVYSSTEVFVPRDMSDLAQWWQISNTRTKSGNFFYLSPITLLKFDSVEIKIFIGKIKVKCTLVQALRLRTGRRPHRGSRSIALVFHDQRH